MSLVKRSCLTGRMTWRRVLQRASPTTLWGGDNASIRANSSQPSRSKPRLSGPRVLAGLSPSCSASGTTWRSGSGDAGGGKRMLRPLQRYGSVRASELQQAGDRAQVAYRQLRTAVQHRTDVAGHRVVDLAGAKPRRHQRRSGHRRNDRRDPAADLTRADPHRIVAGVGEHRVRHREVPTDLEPRQDSLRQMVVQGRKRRGEVRRGPATPPTSPGPGPGAAARRRSPSRRQPGPHHATAAHRPAGPSPGRPRRCRTRMRWPGATRTGPAEGLRWAVGDVEHRQRPGLRDRRHVRHRPDELPQPDHDRVTAHQNTRNVTQRPRPHRRVGEKAGDSAGQLIDVATQRVTSTTGPAPRTARADRPATASP